MTRKLKSAEKRRLRGQIADAEKAARAHEAIALKFAGSWIGRDAAAKAADAREAAKILRMHV